MERVTGGNTSREKLKTDFKFVNYDGPPIASNRRLRTQVRSHVSKWQHRRARERLFEEQQRGDGQVAKTICEFDDNGDELLDDDSGSSTPPPPCTNDPCADQNQADFIPLMNDASGDPNDNTRRQTRLGYRQQTKNGGENHLNNETAFLIRQACTNTLVKPFSQGTAAFRTIALHDKDNTIGTSLQSLHLELSSVMSLYKNICQLQTVDFARQYAISQETDGSCGRFYGFVFTDPILLSTAVLLGVRNQLDILGRDISGRTSASVIQIQQFLMRSINDALMDPKRGVSDQMLIAVALCAAYEIKHGSGTYYHVHMQGLMQMIELRGGLKATGDPDPYIPRLLLWIDTNTSRLAGCAPYLRYTPDKSIAARPEPNSKVFRTKGLMNG